MIAFVHRLWTFLSLSSTNQVYLFSVSFIFSQSSPIFQSFLPLSSLNRVYFSSFLSHSSLNRVYFSSFLSHSSLTQVYLFSLSFFNLLSIKSFQSFFLLSSLNSVYLSIIPYPFDHIVNYVHTIQFLSLTTSSLISCFYPYSYPWIDEYQTTFSLFPSNRHNFLNN